MVIKYSEGKVCAPRNVALHSVAEDSSERDPYQLQGSEQTSVRCLALIADTTLDFTFVFLRVKSFMYLLIFIKYNAMLVGLSNYYLDTCYYILFNGKRHFKKYPRLKKRIGLKQISAELQKCQGHS
ncbi:uncharacterized protein EV154DRAFT_549163 [Mucor mucedo]|uniref:uncharacterized protein n=1 Tax=Mucor mucedo TaxID=29922 RepID=UPI00222075AF|nr:uncharacterized protein EV154DRAFT_549163 [Mucor mucedo]KAI7894472.1 hypothetical protein EV154DRAFT_549163 [Mucor mucedo]